MKKIDIKKNKKKKFNAFIQELINKLHTDEIQDIGTEEIVQTPPQINHNFGDLAGSWWKTNSIILGKELPKKTVGDMHKTVKIFFKMNLDKKLNTSKYIDHFYKALICNVAITATKNEVLRKQLKLK